MKGKFVTVEGCDGVGKSTQVRMLRERLSREGIEAVFTREPGGTPLAEKIRALILDGGNSEMDDVTELLLYEAARRQHTTEKIASALAAGKLVICDRYVDSTLAYQGYGRGLDKDMIKTLNRLAMGPVTIDMTLFLDVESGEAFRRKGGAKQGDRLESQQSDFYERVYEGFLSVAASEPRFIRVDASGDKYQTHEKLYSLLKERGFLGG